LPFIFTPFTWTESVFVVDQLIVDVSEYQTVPGDAITLSVGVGGGGGGVGEDPLLHDIVVAIPATAIRKSIFFMIVILSKAIFHNSRLEIEFCVWESRFANFATGNMISGR
jgi:hypothetical protein